MGNQLPDNFGSTLEGTEPNDSDKIHNLQGEVKNLEDALSAAQQDLSAAQQELIGLKASNKVLSDNDGIKQTAVSFAKVFMIFVPLICLLLLIISLNKGFSISIGSWCFSSTFNMNVNGYAQAALIVAPIAFLATILGFLLKGVFNQKVDTEAPSVSELLRHLENSK